MRSINLTCLLILCLGATTLFAQQTHIYGLNFVNSELRFAKMEISTGEVDILATEVTSEDQISSGVADFDPNEKRYFYVRGLQAATELITVDATTGEVLHRPLVNDPAGAIGPITNIAYNWLDNTLYGVNYRFDDGEELRLASVDVETGELTIISASPTSTTPFLSGNSDLDPINRKYYYATSDRIYTVNLDDGETLSEAELIFPNTEGAQFLTNLTYNWVDGQLYGLHFQSIAGQLESELRLATVDATSGQITLLSELPTSPDGYQMGDCDIDPVARRYYYLRQNNLYIVDLTNGEVLNTVPMENPNGAIAPILNMSLDDLAQPPSLALTRELGETAILEPGTTHELDAYVGDQASYLWEDGSTAPRRTISEPGTYEVLITHDELTIKGNIEILAAKPTATQNIDRLEKLQLTCFPNPTDDFLRYRISGMETVQGQLLLRSASGQLLQSLQIREVEGRLTVKDLSAGIYILELQSQGRTVSQQFVVQR